MEVTMYKLLWVFAIFSFAGWVIGTAAAAFREKKFVDVGFLFWSLVSGIWIRRRDVCSIPSGIKKRAALFIYRRRSFVFSCKPCNRICAGKDFS